MARTEMNIYDLLIVSILLGCKTRHPNLCFSCFHFGIDSILRLTFRRAAFGVFPGFKDLEFKDIKIQGLPQSKYQNSQIG